VFRFSLLRKVALVLVIKPLEQNQWLPLMYGLRGLLAICAVAAARLTATCRVVDVYG